MKTIQISNLIVNPAEKIQTMLNIPRTSFSIPINIIHGSKPGPKILITAGIHGSEYPGIAATIQLANEIKAEEISGTLIIMPLVNTEAFWLHREQIVPQDHKNLNRIFPGKENGTVSEKLAFFFSKEIFPLIDFYIDLHSGDLTEQLLPYVYYPANQNLEIEQQSKLLATKVNANYIVRSKAIGGAYNYANTLNIPSILIERGGAGLCLPNDITTYIDDLYSILNFLQVTTLPSTNTKYQQTIFNEMFYIQSKNDCCWYPAIKCGTSICKGDFLGQTTDLFGNILDKYFAKNSGTILYFCSSLATPKGTILVAYGHP